MYHRPEQGVVIHAQVRARSLYRSIGRARLPDPQGLPVDGGAAAAARCRRAHRLRQGHVLPPPAHAAVTAGCWRRSTRAGIALVSEMRRRKRYRIGYAAQGQDSSFPREVYSGLQARGGVARTSSSSSSTTDISRRWPSEMPSTSIRERVDLVIEFQTDEAVAPAIASKYLEANIPFIAIDIPHPGATYFGANNYQAGLLAGRCLGQWARTRWNGQGRRGRAPGAGPRGIPRPRADERRAGRAQGDAARRRGRVPGGRHSTATDSSRRRWRSYGGISASPRRGTCSWGPRTTRAPWGRSRAFQEAGRAATCAIVGQNAEPDARAELREQRTPLIGVGGLLSGALRRRPHQAGPRHPRPPADAARHLHPPPADHAENVDHFYANDVLLNGATWAARG